MFRKSAWCVSVLILTMALIPSTGHSRGEQGEVRMGLTLLDCVQRAYANNLTLKSSRNALDSIITTVEGAKGAFDPVYFANAVGSESVSPTTSAYDTALGILAYDRDMFNLSTGFTGRLYSGATYTMALNINRTYDPASAAYLAHNPLYYTTLGIDIRQPLLKGGWTTYARNDLIKATLNTRTQALTWEDDVSDVVYQTIQAYWNLRFAEADRDAKQTSLELSKDLLEINTRKKEEGVFSKMEVLEARTDVAIKKEQLLLAENAVEAAEDQLKRLIFPFDRPEEWLIKIVPLTEPEEAREMEFDMEALFMTALTNRPDYRSLKVDYQNRQLDLEKAQNEVKPALDAVGGWRYDAIGSNYGNSFDDIENRKFRYFQVGLELSYPLGNRTAKSTVTRAEIECRRALIAMKDLKIQIEQELRDAVRDMNLRREEIDATRESMSLSKERYEGEKKRLEAGISIPFQVREAQFNFISETVNHTQAILDYQTALAKLSQVTGTLLPEYGIQISHKERDEWLEMMSSGL